MNDASPSHDSKPVVGVGVVALRAGASGLEVLLIQRGKLPRQGEWSIPGGRQEWGETLHSAAHRELVEETGVSVRDLRLIDVVDGLMLEADGSLGRHLTLIDYLGIWTGGDPRPGDDAVAAKWVPVADLPRYNMWSETVRIIRAGVEMGGI